MPRNFAARASRSSSRDILPSESSAAATARPVASTAASGSRWAPPIGLRHDRVDDAELQQVLGGDLHAGRRVLGARGVAPQDRGGRLGRGDGVDRVLEHQHLVAGGDRQRAARAAFADHHRDVRRPQRQADVGGARDRFGLAALFGVDARPGAGGVDQRDDRQIEAVGELHQPRRLANPKVVGSNPTPATKRKARHRRVFCLVESLAI